MLQATDQPLVELYDQLLLDLDGVVYHGPEAVPGAVPSLAQAAARGVALSFVTNNAARPPEQVAAHLAALGVPACADQVVTSAQAGARLLARMVPAGSRVLLCGGAGVEQALHAVGLVPVTGLDAAPVAVITGFGPELPWQRMVDTGIALRGGLPWVACNADLTFPTDAGLAPGHGALVELLERFSGRSADVAGKPRPALFLEAARRGGGERPLVVGDRIDTDIAGGRAAGLPTLLVMTGVTGAPELASCAPTDRPRHLVADLRDLHRPAPTVRVDADRTHCGDWVATCVDGHLDVRGSGRASEWWSALATAAWRHRDTTGEVADVGRVVPPASGPGGTVLP
ncbi:HAD-IIA family hydrolase [Nocardioides daejeonensis]|uniref:HAD-IIA family hydrolase n=1 Tax=Nocardioides daejeonensis TaxID=1046556 RepID=UPI000D74CD7E|nr:HAD-IIA family hydrolase [Nocardioides daejeonensis]